MDDLILYLTECGYISSPYSQGNKVFIKVTITVEQHRIELVHHLVDEITSLPCFFLLNPKKYGQLAHVTWTEIDELQLGYVCVNDRDSISVNYFRPMVAIEESLQRHIKLLSKALTDPVWNNEELKREFSSNWLALKKDNSKDLWLTCANTQLQEIEVFKPVKDVKFGVQSLYLAEQIDSNISAINRINWNSNKEDRTVAGKAIILPLTQLTPAPSNNNGLEEWYIDAINNLDELTLLKLAQSYAQWRARDFWLVLNAMTSSGTTWFALHFHSDKKHTLPLNKEKLINWKLNAVSVRLLNKDKVLPRGGANLDLTTKRVALFGAGSVGGEIAHKLAASGIEKIDIIDDDFYDIDNLYRHILPEYFIGQNKSTALQIHLHRQFPWSQARGFDGKLLDVRKREILSSYDLIVVAIGSPTHERLFKEYLLKAKLDIPVINTWLEGFGVGGHATLDIPESKGCLLCAYVCQETYLRGLHSNLNFIEANQNVTKNLAGCGEQFISYGALCSAQTAIIATDLAIKYLEGKISNSSKTSWKGDSFDAKSNSIKLTHRYNTFDSSLKILPLYHEGCDACD